MSATFPQSNWQGTERHLATQAGQDLRIREKEGENGEPMEGMLRLINDAGEHPKKPQ